MKIEKIFETGKEWIKKNSKDMLYGIIGENALSRIICNIEETSIIEFLEIGSKNGVKVFLVSKSVFDEDEITEEIDLSDLESSKKRKVETQMKKLEKYKNKIEFLSFSYVLDGVIYEYGKVAEWIFEIEVVKTEIEKITKAEQLNFNNEKSLPKKKIKELSELLARHEDFFKRKNDNKKLGLFLLDILEEQNVDEDDMGWYDKVDIISKARLYFDRKLLKEKEMELVRQVKELKENGSSKVAIRSKLDLTEGMLNKYYYK